MQVTVEATGSLERRMTVQVPEDRIASEVQNRLRSLGKTARIHGFRPGKAPPRVVERSYGRQVRDEVVSEVLRTSFADAVTQNALAPAGGPTIEQVAADPGQGLSYTAVFEVYPQVALPDLAALKLDRPVAEVSEQDLDQMILTLRRQRQAWRAVERSAALGDRVVLDYEGAVEGASITGKSGRQVPVELGTHRLVGDLEDRLVGIRAGEEREVVVDFPADHPGPAVAGKAVTFRVTAHRVEEPHLPELDDAFFATFGVSEGGEAALRREVRENMERELRDTLQARVKTAVMDGLLGASPLEVPRALVESEAEALRRQAQESLTQGGTGSSALQLPLSMFQDQARRRVALGLILAELVRSNGIKADPERVRARVASIASTYQEPEEVVRWYYADKRRLAEVENVALEDQVVDWILERAQVTDTPTTFDAVMKPGQTPGGG
jgi:trigger factor